MTGGSTWTVRPQPATSQQSGEHLEVSPSLLKMVAEPVLLSVLELLEPVRAREQLQSPPAGALARPTPTVLTPASAGEAQG